MKKPTLWDYIDEVEDCTTDDIEINPNNITEKENLEEDFQEEEEDIIDDYCL